MKGNFVAFFSINYVLFTYEYNQISRDQNFLCELVLPAPKILGVLPFFSETRQTRKCVKNKNLCR